LADLDLPAPWAPKRAEELLSELPC